MMGLLALRNFFYKPWRSALLFFGFGLGVAVMIILLSIGDAMVVQSAQERLVGGGSITVLPEGIDIEVMKTGGIGGLFFSISNARFLNLQLLAAPRLAPDVRAVAPQIDEQLLYLRPLRSGSVEHTVRASAEIPSAQEAVGAAAALKAGTWADDEADRRWAHPTLAELENDIDHFHEAPAGVAGDTTWAEWHYFNVLSADRREWVFISFIVGRHGGQVLVTTHGDKGEHAFRRTVPASDVTFSTRTAELHMGESSVIVGPDGRYRVHARPTGAAIDLVVTPTPGAYFPGSNIAAGDFVSGYTVPALRADASGTICVGGRCEQWDNVQSYHDHNWGVWRGVTWEWGAARLGRFAVLYGRVQPPDSIGAHAPLFVYLVDSLGFRTLFRPADITYDDTVHVPRHAVMTDVRGADTLRLELDIESATATKVRGRGLTARPYFIQMKGVARLRGRANGAPLDGQGTGFFETYRTTDR
jgi:hypothetical protein